MRIFTKKEKPKKAGEKVSPPPVTKSVKPELAGTIKQHKHGMAGKTLIIGTKALPIAHVSLGKGIRPMTTFTFESPNGIKGVLFIPDGIEINQETIIKAFVAEGEGG